jgi:hypothetical protein
MVSNDDTERTEPLSEPKVIVLLSAEGEGTRGGPCLYGRGDSLVVHRVDARAGSVLEDFRLDLPADAFGGGR